MFHVISDVALKDTRLKPNSKLLLMLITSLSKGPYGCVASNRYFMESLNMKSDKSIRIYLAELKEYGYVTVDMVQRKFKSTPIRVITPLFDMLPKSKEFISNVSAKESKRKEFETDWLESYMQNFGEE